MQERNIRLDIAYDGTNYVGWQRQPNGVSVETKLQEALKGNNVAFGSITGSGRTDAGVHAYGQVANVLVKSSIPSERFAKALNTKLPEDIRILSSREVPMDFHARYNAVGKHYSYRIDTSEISSPIEARYSWNYTYPMDWKRFNEAAKFLEGEHNFGAFVASGGAARNFERNLFMVRPESNGKIIRVDFIGNGFLYNMVRILTGTMAQYAAGLISEEDLKKVFIEPVRENAGITAPAKGLFLEEVFYNMEDLERKIKSLNEDIEKPR